MGYIEHPCANSQAEEIQSILRYDDTAQRVFDMNVTENNPLAVKEVREYVSLCSMQSRQLVLGEIIDRFGARSYGWNEWETALMLVKLFCLGEIQFEYSGAALEKKRVNEVIQKTSNWKKITVRQRKLVDSARIEDVRKLGQKMFGEMGPDKELPLYEFLKSKFIDWDKKLNQYKTLADTGKYPGLEDIRESLRLTAIVLDASNSFDFINRFLENRDALLNCSGDFADIEAFYTKQRVQWDALCSALDRFARNSFDLGKNDTARTALARMHEIKDAPAPYGIIRESATLIKEAEKINDALLDQVRDETGKLIKELTEELAKEGKTRTVAKEDIALSAVALSSLSERIKNEPSIANIRQFQDEAKNVFEQELNRLMKAVPPGKDTPKEIKTVAAKGLSQKPYLETEKDVDDYADILRDELKKLIKEGKRVRIE